MTLYCDWLIEKVCLEYSINELCFWKSWYTLRLRLAGLLSINKSKIKRVTCVYATIYQAIVFFIYESWGNIAYDVKFPYQPSFYAGFVALQGYLWLDNRAYILLVTN